MASRRLRELFEVAADLPEAERAAFLASACGEDVALRERVERLLRALPAARDFLAAPTGGGLEQPAQGERPGSILGRYELLREIGQGGFGVVFLAEQREPVARKVALKVIKLGMDTRQVIARFEAERQALALMQHKNIAAVLDAGASDSGRPYFVMELVQGQPITAYCDQHRLSIGDRLELFAQVCAAVQHAHGKGVIHRDLKPSNVLVATQDGRPLAKVIDFGIAKATAARLTERTLFTQYGQLVGTPAYMSPEQACGSLDIDTRTDVYSLGVLLYELLTGSTPFPTAELCSAGLAEIQRILREVEPPRPSQRLSREAGRLERVAADRRVEPRRLGALLRNDLDWIVMQALEKDRQRRYATADALAADVRRHLAGEPVVAAPTSRSYRLRKLVRRHRGQAFGAAAVALALLAGVLAFAWQAHEAAWQRDDARRHAEAARAQKERAEESERLARAETTKVLRLSDVRVARQLVAAADALWPAHPERIPDLEDWLARARALTARLPEHRATLWRLRGRALPDERGGDQRRADDLTALSAEAEPWRSLRFGTPEEAWQHEVLTELVTHLERELEAGLLASDAVTSEHGWSVARRLEFARELQAGFGAGGAHARAWEAARPEIAAVYGGLDLAAQVGLVPLGQDPHSGLWEFAHLATGEPAVRGTDGELVRGEGTGLVLVLLPGGVFRMGGQASDPLAPNYDPLARSDESPVREVELSPYFLGKHELTQGQWMRIAGHNPSQFGPHHHLVEWSAAGRPMDLTHPVEQVSWLDCMAWLPRAGLLLPSEAQWEFGARGGTDTPWWTGAAQHDLAGAVNLSDRHTGRSGASQAGYPIDEWLDDGFAIHAPVGSFWPNPFGLHDVAGNVWEWCLDAYDQRAYQRDARVDPVVAGEPDGDRVSRGGGCSLTSVFARSSHRYHDPPSNADDDLGLRPARAIDP